MKRKSKKIRAPTLASMMIQYKRQGYKRPKGCARAYMRGFDDAKEYISKSMLLKKINER
jgi:hypothetical protein|tara:strand:- start:186 stop:362 length:177 start_codon:yes stop_codon:yes gene_type:complete